MRDVVILFRANADGGVPLDVISFSGWYPSNCAATSHSSIHVLCVSKNTQTPSTLSYQTSTNQQQAAESIQSTSNHGDQSIELQA
jgi:hypothetical protein